MVTPILSKAAFHERLDESLSFDLAELREAYRKQQLRILTIVILAAAGVLLGLLTFLPSTMVIFLLAGYLVYFFGFGNRRKVRRIKLHEELRRMLIRATIALTDQPFEFHTHRYMPSFVFKESELFAFEPQQYVGDELIEAGSDGRISFSRIKAEEHVDAFESADREQHEFEGWIFRIFPDHNLQQFNLSQLPSHYRSRKSEDQVWMAVPAKGKLYRQGFLHVSPEYDRCYELYMATKQALSLAEGH